MHQKKNNHFLSGILLGTVLGGAYSMLFAQKKGSQLRKELGEAHAKGKKVYQVIAKELQMTGKESVEAVKELIESDSFQKFMKESKMRIDDLTDMAKSKGQEVQMQLKKKFEEFSKDFSQKAHEMEEMAKEKGSTLMKEGSKNLQKAAGALQKEFSKIKKQVKGK